MKFCHITRPNPWRRFAGTPTMAQAQADDALLASWHQGHHDGNVRARFMARLDDMAMRLGAQGQR